MEAPILLLPTNAKLLDALAVGQPQDPSKVVSGLASARLTASYAPIAERLAVGSLPDHLVVSYDVVTATFVLADLIDGVSIAVLARKALAPKGRHAE